MKRETLNEICYLHNKWIYSGRTSGKRADLSYTELGDADLRNTNLERADLEWADLRYADLSGANLSGANLINVDLRNANLSGANLSGANLSDAYLPHADLSNSNLIRANLSYANIIYTNLNNADIRYANLTGSNLTGADLNEIKYNEKTAMFIIQCPEKGSFTGYKKAQEYIIELYIPDDAKRSSATSRICRCNKAEVVSITNLDGSQSNLKEVNSDFDASFTYKIGETVVVEDFKNNRWTTECANGIHFFITREEAVNFCPNKDIYIYI